MVGNCGEGLAQLTDLAGKVLDRLCNAAQFGCDVAPFVGFLADRRPLLHEKDDQIGDKVLPAPAKVCWFGNAKFGFGRQCAVGAFGPEFLE